MARPPRYFTITTDTTTTRATRPYDNEKVSGLCLTVKGDLTGPYTTRIFNDETPQDARFGKDICRTVWLLPPGLEVPDTGNVIEATHSSDGATPTPRPQATPDEPTPAPKATSKPNTAQGVSPFTVAFDADAINAFMRQAIKEQAEKIAETHVRRLEVKVQGKTEHVEIKNAHHGLPTLIKAVAAGVNVLLVGPAGSSKTTACKQTAEALGIAFDFKALGPTITESAVFGYMNASGSYVETAFRRVYENGGLFLFDEMDAANPSVLVAINAAIENGVASFPDGLIHRHPDAHFVAAANTFGRGATAEYVGRNALDAATLDRFFKLRWDYDEKAERLWAGNDTWTDTVQATRKALESVGVKRHVVSPRASIRGAKLLAAGLPQTMVEEGELFWGLEPDTIRKIKASRQE